MDWLIIGRDMHVLCSPSTDLPDTLPIYDGSSDLGQEISIVNNCAVGTYDFTTDPRHTDSVYVAEGNYIAFRDKYGKDRLYTIMTVDGDEEWNVHCEDIGIDLINEYATPWDYTGNPKTIEDTLEPVIFDSGWKIGINEVLDYKRATKFEGTTDSQLTRIADVCNQFDCECEFVIEMKGAKVSNQLINIYKSIGQDRIQQCFIDNINLISLRKSGSIEDLITCVRCYGKEGENGNRLTIADIEYDDGRYYSPKGNIRIFDREAHQKWSRFRAFNYEGQGEFDGYINGTFEYDTEDPQELFNRGLSYLQENNDVKVSYEANVYDIKADIGDTVQISDNSKAEKVYLSARIQSVRNHYTVVGEDTGTLANYKILTSKPTTEVQEAIDKLKGQLVSVRSTDIAYQIGESGVEPPTGEWLHNPPQTEPGQYLWTRKITTYTNNSTTTEYSVSRNGENGEKGDTGPEGPQGPPGVDGLQGPQGEQGIPGKDGISTFTHIAYANSSDGKIDFSVSDSNRDYVGMYVDSSIVDSENPEDYAWSKIKGADGSQGIQGKPGADGKTPYFHIAYSNSSDGNDGFSTTDSTNKLYIGQYTDYTESDSNDPAKYSWTKIKGDKGEQGIQGEKGEQGIQGENGTDGKTTYFHVKYSENSSGYPMLDDPSTYIGTYVDFEEKDSDNYLDYKWSKFQGTDGIPGVNGEDGKTSYLHIKYSNDGGITFTDNNGETSGDWIGQYVDFEIADSMVPSDYKWAKIKGNDGDPGEDGKPGTDGKPGENGKDGQMLYATSSSASDDPEKVASLVDGELQLTAGVCVTVLFTNENSVDDPTLNINNTGSKPIITQGLPSAYWTAGSSVVFVYDGTNWQVASSPVYASEATIGNPSAANVFIDGSTVSVRQAKENRFTFGRNDFRNYIKGDYIYIGSKAPEESGSSESPHIEMQSDGVHTEEGKIATYKYFSEDETITSDIWIDGKPIYQKVIDAGSLSSQSKVISHGIANVDRIWVDISNSFLIASTGITYTLPRLSNLNVNQMVPVRVDKTKIYVDAGTDANFTDCYVTLRYTKTN